MGLRTLDAEQLGRHLKWFQEQFGKEATEAEALRLGDRQAWCDWRFTHTHKLSIMDVCSATNERTMFAALVDHFPCGHSAPLITATGGVASELCTEGVFNSFACDQVLRDRVGGLHLTWHCLEETSAPIVPDLVRGQFAVQVAHLSLLSVAFADIWLKVLGDTTTLETSWRSRWAVTLLERLRVRCILDAVVAHLYGLNAEDFAWILRDCDQPLDRTRDTSFTRLLDAKGFWRVDKEKRPELRHTVLAQVAFHDLQAMGLEAFLAQNSGEGWMLPDTVRLSDYGLGHDDRANQPQPVASQFGDRFLPWQLNEDVEQSWKECRRHAESIRAIRSRFAPEPAAAAQTSGPATPQPTSTPPAVDLLGQPIPTDLFGNEITQRRRK
jgi:hypothetical protein